MPTAHARGSVELWSHRSGLDGVPRPLPVNATLRMGVDSIRLEPTAGSERALAALEGGQPWVLDVSLGRRQATQSMTGASR